VNSSQSPCRVVGASVRVLSLEGRKIGRQQRWQRASWHGAPPRRSPTTPGVGGERCNHLYANFDKHNDRERRRVYCSINHSVKSALYFWSTPLKSNHCLNLP